jgi:NADH-quinone oxidoreductase chain G
MIITIDKNIVSVNNNMSILQACESINLIVPKFCYHERLSVAGNCRMCLVEVEKAPKLVASCASPVMPNMVVNTNSLAVKKAREGVLEFLLLNHPLDCAICDQAGECDLQDQTMVFGSDRSRFLEYKRATKDIQCGPLIKTIMTRCIHCTRCVRFANEVIGIPDLGTSGRGNNLAINLYINKVLKSEFSGNLIDLCPVGALTSKPYTFIARPWELRSIESIDTFDGIGANIRIDVRGYEIMRILPRLNEHINEEWISDKTRFAFDGLKRQRLYEPLLKQDNQFNVINWQEAFKIIYSKLNLINNPYKIAANIGQQSDFESMIYLKNLIESKQGLFLNSEKTALNNLDFQNLYLFNSTISKLDKTDACLILGSNPRLEGSIINLRLRKRYITGGLKLGCFGSFLDLTFPIYNFGSTLVNLIKFIEGKHPFCEYFVNAKKPILIIGKSFFQTFGEKQARLFINILSKNTTLTKNNWDGINFLHDNISSTGQFELGIKTQSPKYLDIQFLFCIGESNIKRFSQKTFIVYQGHQGNSTASMADMILPSTSFIEKNATFINVEGRYQKTKAVLFPPGNSKEDQSILYTLSMGLGLNLKNFKITYLRKNFTLFVKQVFLVKSKIVLKNSFLPSAKLENFYCSDNISKSSVTMMKCSKILLEKTPFLKY